MWSQSFFSISKVIQSETWKTIYFFYHDHTAFLPTILMFNIIITPQKWDPVCKIECPHDESLIFQWMLLLDVSPCLRMIIGFRHGVPSADPGHGNHQPWSWGIPPADDVLIFNSVPNFQIFSFSFIFTPILFVKLISRSYSSFLVRYLTKESLYFSMLSLQMPIRHTPLW